MLLKGEQLGPHLERELRPLYVVYGDAPLLVLEAADSIRAKARAHGYNEREVLTVLGGAGGFDWKQLAAAHSMLSLFGDRKLIDLRLPTGKPGKEGSAALQDYCQHLSADSLLLVTLPDIDWREEKSAWFTALAQAGAVVRLDAPPLAELPGWLAGRLRRQQQKADRDALDFLAERVEGNLLAAHQEIRKLGLLYPSGTLTLVQVREAVLNVARYDIEGLREALLQGDAARLFRTLDGLQHEGEAPTLILWAFSEEIRALTQIRYGQRQGQPLDVLLKTAKVWGARQALVKRALQRLTLPLLEDALHQAASIDRLIKGVGQGDVWEAFTRLGMTLCPAGIRAGHPNQKM